MSYDVERVSLIPHSHWHSVWRIIFPVLKDDWKDRLVLLIAPYLLYVSDRRYPRDREEAVARIIGAVLHFVRSWSQILKRSRSRSRIQRGAVFDRSVQEFDTDRSVTYLSDPLLPIPPCWVELIRLEYVTLMLQCATVMMSLLNTVLRSFEFIATSTSTIRT